ncbi:MAG: hypothetical protein ACI8X5_003723 [Planctomycetota bacterium]|jgi:hypothetical protein
MNCFPKKIQTLAVLCLPWLAGCGEQEARPATPAQLRQAIERTISVEVQVSSGHLEEATNSAVLAGVRSLTKRSGKQVTLVQGIDGDSSGTPRIVLGNSKDPALVDLFLKIGGEVVGDVWSYHGVKLGRENSLLTICAEDPERKGLPLQLFVGRFPRSIQTLVEDLSLRGDPVAVSLGERFRELEFTRKGLEHYPPFPSTAQGGGMLLHYAESVSEKRALKYTSRTARTLRRLQEWAGFERGVRFDVLAVGSAEELRDCMGVCDLSGSDGIRDRRVVLLAPNVPDDEGQAIARWSAKENLGSPQANWMLDGIAIDAAGVWWGRDLESWGRYLAVGGLLPSLKEIVADVSVDRISQHALAPARGLLMRYIRIENGRDHLRELWKGAETLLIDEESESAFSRWVLSSSEDASASRELERSEREAARASMEFMSGVALDSNLRVGGGLSGPGLSRSFRDARSFKVNSISITSFFTEKATRSLTPGGRIPRGRTSIEGDAALAQAIGAARRSGMTTVMLQPHLLLSESGGYSAWIKRTNPEHWQEYFDAVDPMLIHYGLLAELCDVDILCVGTNQQTRAGNQRLQPDARETHDLGWLNSIDLARQAFGGALTYAASWPGEASSIRFWDRLDFVGFSFFPRIGLGRWESLTDSGLLVRLEGYMDGMLECAANAKRPGLIVEMGVRSTEFGLAESSVGVGSLNVDEQTRYWRAVSRAIASRPQDANKLAGLFAWKWNSDASGGGTQDRGFSVQNKPASRLLGRFSAGAEGAQPEADSKQDDR